MRKLAGRQRNPLRDSGSFGFVRQRGEWYRWNSSVSPPALSLRACRPADLQLPILHPNPIHPASPRAHDSRALRKHHERLGHQHVVFTRRHVCARSRRHRRAFRTSAWNYEMFVSTIYIISGIPWAYIRRITRRCSSFTFCPPFDHKRRIVIKFWNSSLLIMPIRYWSAYSGPNVWRLCSDKIQNRKTVLDNFVKNHMKVQVGSFIPLMEETSRDFRFAMWHNQEKIFVIYYIGKTFAHVSSQYVPEIDRMPSMTKSFRDTRCRAPRRGPSQPKPWTVPASDHGSESISTHWVFVSPHRQSFWIVCISTNNMLAYLVIIMCIKTRHIPSYIR